MCNSGNKQVQAKLGCVEIKEFAVAFGPPTRCQIITKAAYCPLLNLRPNFGKQRYSTADMLIQICLGPPPVGFKETIGAVPRDEHRLHPGSDCLGQFTRKANGGGSELRQIVTCQPEPAVPALFTGIT